MNKSYAKVLLLLFLAGSGLFHIMKGWSDLKGRKPKWKSGLRIFVGLVLWALLGGILYFLRGSQL